MLKGTRIIEVEGLGPGPFAAMMLADLGADVIVVHRPETAGTPGMPDQPLLDRGKRSITLDLKDAEDAQTFKKLVASADALIEGFRPGVMERLGLGPEAFVSSHPRLVYGRMTGWGQQGSYSQMAGHDLNYISMSGAAWYASLPETPPFPPPTLVGDIGGGALYLVIGILAGIMSARQTGQGTVVDAAIIDGSAHMMNLLMTLRQSGGLREQRGASLLDGPHWSRTYRTQDNGFMSVQCLEPKFYAVFLEKLGLSDRTEFSEQFDQNLWPKQAAELEKIFISKTRSEWEQIFAGSDACAVPVLSPEEAREHAVNADRQIWHEEDGILQAAPAPRFAYAAPWSPRKSPLRGEHDGEIRAEIEQMVLEEEND